MFSLCPGSFDRMKGITFAKGLTLALLPKPAHLRLIACLKRAFKIPNQQTINHILNLNGIGQHSDVSDSCDSSRFV